jgi:NADPH-dependent curcumin reductase
MTLNKGFKLSSRPQGSASEDNFKYFETEMAEPQPGQVLIRNLWLSLDPYMRFRMDEGRSYTTPQGLEEVMVGATVGEVLASKNSNFKIGEKIVARNGGWQLYFMSDGDGLRKIAETQMPLQAYLGMPGVTAWIGLNRIIAPKTRDTIVVSAATGAVGSVVGQLAKAAGARVIGIAGGTEKCRYAIEVLGFDACVDHKAADFPDQLATATPAGVDGLFENVGGQPFAQSLQRMNDFGRIAICGLIASYEGKDISSINDLRIVLVRRLMMKGFIVSDYLPDWPQALSELFNMASTNELKWRESIAVGIENAPTAFLGMLNGKNFGKQLVRLV